jgi:hypothetical protein
MATKKKPVMSAEEKAVRDALAAVQADTGIQQAYQALGISTPAPTPTPVSNSLGTVSDIDTSTAYGKQSAEVIKRLQDYVNKTEPDVVKKAADLGYDVDLNTGTLTPKVTGGSTSGTTSDTTSGTTSGLGGNISNETKDAYAIIEDTLNTYGLSSLATVIKGYMLSGLGPEQAKLQIKQEPIYKARFKGNETRIAAGLNALSEAEYLNLEDTYNQVMNQYGLGDYFGSTASARQSKIADVIGGDISPVEFKDRISTVVDRVSNADASIKKQLKDFYPNITDTDLVKYFLDPAQTLPALQQKVTAAEIGAAATAQNLGTSATSAENLAKYGIDRAAALKGYATIGGLLPESKKLSDIYGEAKIDYTQNTAEEEIFKGNASAARKRKQLAQLESASFSGQSGVGKYGLDKSIQGSF